VTVVELVQEVADAFESFHADAAKVRAYPKGRIVVNDGRNFLALTRERFDVITLDPPPPIDGAGVNNLYSRDFIELAKAHLKPGGIMAHWIPFPGTQSGVDDRETFDMLVDTFSDVFPYVVAVNGFHGVGLHVLGSSSPIDLSTDRLRRRLEAKEIREDVNEWDLVPFSYFESIKPLPRSATPVDFDTDDHPWLEFYLLGTWSRGGKKTFALSYW
jgi:spermidine synthase